MRRFLICLAILLFAMPATAAQKRIHYSSGTGFFVSPYGHIITNAHVIQKCITGKVEVSGAYSGTAKISASDDRMDLALLEADGNSPGVGRLVATDRTIAEGDEVMVMGYPLDAAIDGQYRVALATIVGIQGPTGEAQWLQFSSSAQKGNSGGPLLDTTGNVIGVVTGKTEVTGRDSSGRETTISQSDIAVNLEILKAFLHDNHIRYQQAESLTQRSERAVESIAQRFIVSLKCVTGEEIVP